jgi:hypothetical protein
MLVEKTDHNMSAVIVVWESRFVNWVAMSEERCNEDITNVCRRSSQELSDAMASMTTAMAT